VRQKDAQNSTLKFQLTTTALSAQLRAALNTNRFGASVLVARLPRSVASPSMNLNSRIAGELGGGEGVRTPDLRLAKPALCQTELRPQS
jgi:hypothetical protein